VARAIANRIPDAATFDQSIVCCHWETSIPGNVGAALAVVGESTSRLATTASRHEVLAMRAVIGPPGYAPDGAYGPRL
jgi:hypothetical protein